MGKEVKQIDINNRTYYFYNNINHENLDSNLLKIDKTHYKSINMYYIRYITITDDCENIQCESFVLVANHEMSCTDI